MLTCEPLGSPYVGVTFSLVGASASVILRCTAAIAESPSAAGGPVAHMRVVDGRGAKRGARMSHTKAGEEAACDRSVRVASVAKQARRMTPWD